MGGAEGLIPTTSATACCGVNGIACSGPTIVTLFWPSKNLGGAISTNFNLLPSLGYINLQNNGLFGPFPANLVTMTQLQRINFSFNRLTGTIPTGFGTFPFFIELDVSYNEMSGTIPADLFAATSDLQFFVIRRNSFSGSMPPISTSSIRWYIAGENQLSGTVPSLDAAVNMKWLYDLLT
jgi:hypothetical protein